MRRRRRRPQRGRPGGSHPGRFGLSRNGADRELLEQLFPELDIGTVVAIDDGWDCSVLEVNGEWIFRFPRRPEVESWLAKELALLPALAPTLPLPVPQFELVSRDPLWCLGYRKIPGRPLSEHLTATSAGWPAARVGRFLRALHSFPVERAGALGVPSYDQTSWRGHFRTFCEELRERVSPLLAASTRELASAHFETFLGNDEHFHFEPTLIHADLGPEHLLGDGREVSGVIDWTDARVGDPALDLAWLLHGTPPAFGDAVLAAYGRLDPTLRARALFYYRLGPWHEVVYGLRVQRQAVVESGLAGIRGRLDRHE